MKDIDCLMIFLLVLVALCVLKKIIAAIRGEWQRVAQEKEKEARAAQVEADKARAAAEKERIQQEKSAQRAAREAARQQRQAEKLEAARQMAEYKERALQAEKELQAIRARNIQAAQGQEASPQEAQKPQEPPKKNAQQEQEQPKEAPETAQEQPAALSLAQFARQNAPQPFKGQAVSFTGTLYDAEGKHVPRAQAIQLVTSLGGKAYETMPAGTTLLVVGKKPGMGKLDKADEWIGQVKKITPAQFFAMAQG